MKKAKRWGLRWRGKREEVFEKRRRRDWVKERKEEESRSARRKKMGKFEKRERRREWVKEMAKEKREFDALRLFQYHNQSLDSDLYLSPKKPQLT